MRIAGARVATGSASAAERSLWIRDGRISFSPVSTDQSVSLDLNGFLLLPGLINAHDHLELNLFPRLGRGPYSNASDWAKDIYRPNEAPIKDHLAVPKALRLRWGGIKNLISGVTTVAHHNAFHPVFLDSDFPVRVIRKYSWAHSLQFSPDWKSRFERTPAGRPFVIHAAEGTDKAARREIRTLAKAGVLDHRTILVHAVAADPSDVPVLRRCAGIVWCPSSNHFTLGRSLNVAAVQSALSVALGTDSAITGEGDLLDELRFARRNVDPCELYKMVTSGPAHMFGLPAGFGQICEGGPADLLVLDDHGRLPAMALLESFPEAVLVRGRVKLISARLARLCPPRIMESLEPIEIEGRGSYLISGPVSSMVQQTKERLRAPARLAGKAIAA